ncbi:MAG: PAS domain S-box protein [Bacteroidia bacterium]
MIENKYLIEIFNASPIPSLLLEHNGLCFKIKSVNRSYLIVTNKSEKELVGKNIFEVFPELVNKNDNLLQSLNRTISSKLPNHIENNRYDLPKLDSIELEIKYWDITNTPIFDENDNLVYIIHNVIDVTQKRYLNLLEKLEKEILEMNSLSKFSLSKVISKYMLGIESLHPGMICSMQEIIDNKLYNLASPSLPVEYLDIISGLEIGNNVGSCGTAAFIKQNVIVSDILTDIRWANYLDIIKQFDFKACWSHPIINSNGEVMATFACYYNSKKTPEEMEQNTINRAGNIFKIILENHNQTIALKQNEEQFRLLVNDMQVGVLLQNEKSEILISNPKALELLGLTEDQLLGKSSFDTSWNVIHEDGSPFPGSTHPVPQAIALRKPIRDIIMGVYRPEIGDRIWLLVNAFPEIENDKLNHVVCTFIDITKRKHAEEELRLSKTTYSGIINSISELIYVQDKNGCFLDVNKAVEKTYGYSKDFFIGKTPEFLAAPNKNNFENISNAIDLAWKGIPQSFDFWGITQNGNIFPKEVNLSLGNYFGKPAIIAVARNVSDRKNSEEVILKNEEKLSTLLLNMADWVWEIDENDKYTFASKKCFDLFGILPENLIGKTPFDLMPPGEVDLIKEKFQEIKTNKMPIKELINWNIGKNGDRICLLTNGLPIIDKEGNFKGYRGVDIDITERVKAEENIRKSEEILKTIIDNAPIGIWYMNSLGKMEFVNKKFCNSIGITEETFKSAKHYSEIYPPEAAKVCMESDLFALNNVGPQIFHESFQFTDGKIHDLEIIKFQILEEKTGKPGLIGLMRDVTEETQAKLELQKSEERYKTLIELSPEPIAVNSFGKVVYVNTAAIKLFGANNANEIVGKNTIDFVHPDFKEFTVQRMEVIYNGGPDIEMGESKLLKLDGTVIEVEAQGNAIVYNGEKSIQISMRDVTKRKHAEREMLLSNERYELVGKATSDSIWDWNVITDEVIRLGDGFKTLFGYNNEETINDNKFWQKIVHPDDLPWVSASIFKTLHDPNELYWEEEFRIQKACGTYTYVKDKGFIIRNKNGKAIRMIGATQDINSIKKSELALVENIKSLEDFKFALNQSAIIAMTDENGIILSVNDNFCKLSEYSEEELVGKTHQIINSKFHSDEFFNEMWQTISMGKVWKGDVKNKKKSGELYWVNATIIPFLNNEKKPFQYLAIRFDITERKKAEEALIDSNDRYNLVAKATNDSIWDWDLNSGIIKRTGEGFKVLFGYETEHANYNWKELVHKEDLERVQESLEVVMSNQNISYWEQDFRFLKANGKYAFVNDKGYVIRDLKGKAIRMIGATQDITERVKHLNAIEAQNKKLRQIAWDQSHIVRAPLSRMMAIVSLLKELDYTAAEFKEWIKHFEESGEELDRVIHEITNKSEEINLDL